MPYSGSPALPRRPYFSRIARRRTSPVGLDGELHDVEQVHGDAARGSIRRTADRKIAHMSIATTWTASRQAGVAPASQYAASSAVRPSTWPSMPCSPARS